MDDLGQCRSCRAAIRWVEMPSGKKNPLDADPSPVGNVRLCGNGKGEVVKGSEVVSAREAGEALYLSHFATCKQSSFHRKPK